MTCNSSTLPIKWSRRLGVHAHTWEEGCAVSSGTKVKCSISSLVSPPSSSLGIWETPTNGLRIWALLQIMVCALIRSYLCMTWSPLEFFTLALKIRDMTRFGNGKVRLEFLFVMHLVKRQQMWLKCRSPCGWRDQIGIWTLVLTSSSSSSPGRGWRSWYRPKFVSPGGM